MSHWDHAKSQVAAVASPHTSSVIQAVADAEEALAASADVAGDVVLWDALLRPRRVCRLGGPVAGLSINAESHLLAAVAASGTLCIVDLRDSRPDYRDLGRGAHSLALSKDGALVAVGIDDASILVLRRADNAQARLFGLQAPANHLQFSPSSQRLLANSPTGELRLWGRPRFRFAEAGEPASWLTPILSTDAP